MPSLRSRALALTIAALATAADTAGAASAPEAIPSQIHKIRHVIVIMQENRSFDSYFGSYPGADGIPMVNGVPAVCVPDPRGHRCVMPYHNPRDVNHGGPHGEGAAFQDIGGGLMNGFIATAQAGGPPCRNPNDPVCTIPGETDVMGYHDGGEIPNYWDYARNFVLQDHMFEPNLSWSLPQHLFEVSGWSALCTVPADAMSCVNALQSPAQPPDFSRQPVLPDYAWTDATWLLHRRHVSWGYYVFAGGEPDCVNDESVVCSPVSQNARTPGIWNPLPYFDTVREDGELGNVQSLTAFYTAAREGTLPAVSWVSPNSAVSEHPPASVAAGQAYVTTLVNAVMRSPDWPSTAIFVSWDDWGGFYDHVVPPRVDFNGYGLRVPGLLISPYARAGYVDHQVLSHDAYLKFIEDDFLGGERIDPRTDGRPDPRPDVREASPALGDLLSEFDFSQPPAPPLLLPAHPLAWSLPQAFRLRLQTPAREHPRFHGNAVVVEAACAGGCRLELTVHLHAGRGRTLAVLVLPRRRATLAGAGAVRVPLGARARAFLRRERAAGRRLSAYVTATAEALAPATPLTPAAESTSGTLTIALSY